MSNQEIRYSNDQITDAHGTVMEQVSSSLGSDQETYFNTDTQSLPRPDFGVALYKTYGDEGLDYADGLVLEADEVSDLRGEQWDNMRVALGLVSADRRLTFFPATITPEGKALYMGHHLISDPSTHMGFHDMQHDALNTAYMTHTSDAGHESGAGVNAAESRHGLIVASSASHLGAHDTVHRLDRTGDFASNVGAIGLLDVKVGDKALKRETKLVDLDAAHQVVVRAEFQPPQEPLFQLDVPPQQLVIAGTLAAARSRGVHVRIDDNISAMVEKAR